jgi:hypothetical protein
MIEISPSEHQFKNSSVAFLSVLFLTFIAYTVSRIIKNKRTDYGHKDAADTIPLFCVYVIKVVEEDMAPSFLIYGIAITYGAFFAILAILGYVLMAVQIGLFIAYYKKNYKLLQICRISNVVLVGLCFLALFVDSLSFPGAANNVLNDSD